MADKKLLEDPEWLFSMLAAIMKREGGEIKVSDEELLDVSKKDIVGLFYDKRDSCIILRLINPAEVFGNSVDSLMGDKLDN
jgi:hypothetical protein